MKKLIVTALLSLPLAFSARAQWIVYDPTVNMQQILAQAENIAKYIQMIENQVQQIQALTDQLNEFKHYEDLFGNPSQVALSLVGPIVSDLRSLEPGINLESLVSTADGNYALTYNGSGLYVTVGANFQTPRGQTITAKRLWGIPMRQMDCFILGDNPIANGKKTSPSSLLILVFETCIIFLFGWRLELMLDPLMQGRVKRVHAEKYLGTLMIEEPWVSEIKVIPRFEAFPL